MRTREQNAKRYFGALWYIFLLLITAMSMVALIAKEPIPDFAFIIAMIGASIGAAVVGFLHGITLFVAREQDQADREKEVA